VMHQIRDEKDKAVALAYAEVANAKQVAKGLSVVETRCEQLLTINHQLSSQVSTLKTQQTAFDRLEEGEIAELQGAKDTMDCLREKAVWERREALETAKAREGEAQVLRDTVEEAREAVKVALDRAAKAETLLAKVSGTRLTRSKSFDVCTSLLVSGVPLELFQGYPMHLYISHSVFVSLFGGHSQHLLSNFPSHLKIDIL